jgi:outer membrane protein TolC
MALAISQRCGLRLAVFLALIPALSRPPALPAQEEAPPPLRAQEEAPPPAVYAESAPVRRLTLEEARQLAIENNKKLGLARLNVKEKCYAKTAAWKDYFPKLLASVAYFHFNENLGQVLTFQKGRFGLLAPGSIPVEVNVLNQNSALSTVFLAQPITKLIAVHAATQIARADENAARAQLDKGLRDLLSGVTQAYQGLLGVQRIQATLQAQIKMLEEVLQVKAIPEVRIALVEARQGLLQVRGQVVELRQQLNDLLDLPPCTVLELVDPVPVDPPVRCAEDAAAAALANSPEVRAAEQDIAKARAALRVARLDYVPDVAIIGGFANQTAANYIQPDIGYLGIFANYTCWDWGKRRDISRMRQTQIAMAQQNLQVTVDKVQADARKAYGTFEQAREAYQLAREMVEARKAAEKGAAGMAALQAKAETSRAELEQMKAEIAYRVAHAQLTGLLGME